MVKLLKYKNNKNSKNNSDSNYTSSSGSDLESSYSYSDSNSNSDSDSDSDYVYSSPSDSDSEYRERKSYKRKRGRGNSRDRKNKKITPRNMIIKRLKKDKYYNKLNKSEKTNIIDIELELYNFNKQIIPNRYKILNMNTSIANKSLILKKLDIFDNMDENCGEYNKISKWVNGISMIPFGIYKKPLVSNNNSINDIQTHINSCYKKLDEVLYGQYNVKNKIMQIISQSIINPLSKINILALEGPPGVGKTSLVKNGLSKILNKPFHLIALGGCNDASTLEGHNYTYEGSNWGKLVNILMQSQCVNPIIYFDELDKISKTSRGKE